MREEVYMSLDVSSGSKNENCSDRTLKKSKPSAGSGQIGKETRDRASTGGAQSAVAF